MKTPYIVACMGKRDYYQAAVALSEAGSLDALLTDFYCPEALGRLMKALPWGGSSAHRRQAHRRTTVSSRRVPVARQERGRLCIQHWWAPQPESQEAARRRAGPCRGGSGALVYNYYWPGFISDPRTSHRGGALRLLFQAHPVPHQVRRILFEDRMCTEIKRGLEFEERLSGAEVEEHSRLLSLADGVIVPSSFVAEGVRELGIARERIRIVPYGGDVGVRAGSDPWLWQRSALVSTRAPGPLHLPCVARPIYRKGLHHLYSALAQLTPGSVMLTVVAANSASELRGLSVPAGVRVVGSVGYGELLRLYAESDAFVLPSLVEGFGLVYLGAMRMGLPIICTQNTDGPDVMQDGSEGPIVPAGDVAALARAIRTLSSDRAMLDGMRRNAANTAASWTWQRFRQSVCAAIEAIEEACTASGVAT